MPKRKQPEHSGLLTVAPLTDAQEDVFDLYEDRFNLFLHGVAGTGKTFVALYLALKEVFASQRYHKVVIVRSAVPARDVGHLPGTLAEKLAAYETPYLPMLTRLFGRKEAYQEMVQKGLLEFISTSHLRGCTFEGCVIIADEVQNCTFQELDTLITRVGKDCRMVICGDIVQTDLIRSKNDATGFPLFFSIVKDMSEFRFVEFGVEDIVRSGLVKSYILSKIAHEKMASTSR